MMNVHKKHIQAVNDADVLKEIMGYGAIEIPAKYLAARNLIEKNNNQRGKKLLYGLPLFIRSTT